MGLREIKRRFRFRSGRIYIYPNPRALFRLVYQKTIAMLHCKVSVILAEREKRAVPALVLCTKPNFGKKSRQQLLKGSRILLY